MIYYIKALTKFYYVFFYAFNNIRELSHTDKYIDSCRLTKYELYYYENNLRK